MIFNNLIMKAIKIFVFIQILHIQLKLHPTQNPPQHPPRHHFIFRFHKQLGDSCSSFNVSIVVIAFRGIPVTTWDTGTGTAFQHILTKVRIYYQREKQGDGSCVSKRKNRPLVTTLLSSFIFNFMPRRCHRC